MNLQPKDTSKWHFYVSLAKSLVRIGAGTALGLGFVGYAGILFVAAEGLGVLEELA